MIIAKLSLAAYLTMITRTNRVAKLGHHSLPEEINASKTVDDDVVAYQNAKSIIHAPMTNLGSAANAILIRTLRDHTESQTLVETESGMKYVIVDCARVDTIVMEEQVS